jgi:hypothetical protein
LQWGILLSNIRNSSHKQHPLYHNIVTPTAAAAATAVTAQQQQQQQQQQ